MKLGLFAVLLSIFAIFMSGCGGKKPETSMGLSKYVIQDMGEIGFVDQSEPTFGINDNGIAVGTTKESFANKAFIWKNGERTYIESQGETIAYDINNAGQVVGREGNRAFMWKDGVMTKLNISAGSSSQARAINSAGEIAGSVYTDGNGTYAAVWKNGVLTQICPGIAEDINDSGTVVGQSSVTGHAFIWQNGGITDLGSIVGDSFARSINVNGLVIGSTGARACKWLNGICSVLDMLDDYSYSKANAVNSLNQIVGQYNGKAAIWQNSRMDNLNTLIPQGTGWELVEARDINSVGQITGWGYFNNVRHAFILTPAN